MQKNIIDELAELAIGARMKRLYESLSRDVMKIYADHHLNFETKYFTLFYLISKRGEIGIMDIAEELSLSHPGVINLAKELEKKGYIESFKPPGDNRKRSLRLSKKGLKALPEFELVWNKIYKTNKLLFAKQQHHLLKALEETEALLEKESYYKRFKKVNP
ncbi:MAG TPA: MarR family transcriptional regulator [Panacibacter sp.]|nr:MarR family transcriptional regulator [Panacibacter sp.]